MVRELQSHKSEMQPKEKKKEKKTLKEWKRIDRSLLSSVLQSQNGRR